MEFVALVEEERVLAARESAIDASRCFACSTFKLGKYGGKGSCRG